MVTEILLPTFRRVIPVCRKVFRQETRAYTGWPIWEGEVEERRREGAKKRKNSKVDFSRDRVHTFSSLLILSRLEVGHFANFSRLFHFSNMNRPTSTCSGYFSCPMYSYLLDGKAEEFIETIRIDQCRPYRHSIWLSKKLLAKLLID